MSLVLGRGEATGLGPLPPGRGLLRLLSLSQSRPLPGKRGDFYHHSHVITVLCSQPQLGDQGRHQLWSDGRAPTRMLEPPPPAPRHRHDHSPDRPAPWSAPGRSLEEAATPGTSAWHEEAGLERPGQEPGGESRETGIVALTQTGFTDRACKNGGHDGSHRASWVRTQALWLSRRVTLRMPCLPHLPRRQDTAINAHELARCSERSQGITQRSTSRSALQACHRPCPACHQASSSRAEAKWVPITQRLDEKTKDCHRANDAACLPSWAGPRSGLKSGTGVR